MIEDATKVAGEKYGGGLALTNGIQILVTDGSTTLLDITDGVPVKTNAGYARTTFQVVDHVFGTGNEYVSVRFDFGLFSGREKGLRLIGGKSHELQVLLDDDMQFLVTHSFKVGGYVEGRELGD